MELVRSRGDVLPIKMAFNKNIIIKRDEKFKSNQRPRGDVISF